VPRVSAVSSQDAATAIAEAEHALQAAFVSVSDTQRVGVNVSGLLIRLNEAGLALTKAEGASNDGNYPVAVDQAAASKTLADDVATDAAAMKSEAAGRFSDFLFTFMFGFLGAGGLLAVLVLIWLWFKRYYSRKFSNSRPEVTA
jgi:hypothetical protein